MMYDEEPHVKVYEMFTSAGVIKNEQMMGRRADYGKVLGESIGKDSDRTSVRDEEVK